ncbi:putative amidohydrolase [Kineosphaera limosa]|uniref:Putative hydrolase n=1 Tax=Kineosphaera limosa NBRC 100340 TaxID=1184609 RepID=K6WTT8_9MICO|nr:carbon-nitrogen hydrolase family protein [Kineosphaera limosa]NYD99936.1 putative amidohydrolase [Kineosphaera limosa]GAB95527.1 putative hydrolase [Kineosphaera limosa NBRC 100340]
MSASLTEPSNVHLTVAACQISAGADPRQNLATATAAVQEAADAGARLAVLPEATMASFGTPLHEVAQPLDGEFADGIRALADRLDLTVVAGMFEPADDRRVYNTLLLAGPRGEVAYRKIHLYDAFGSRESDTVAPGSQLVTAVVDGVTVGLATCYDVRFADQFSALGRAGAQLVLLSASWGEGPGKAEQWDVLVRARAMDAQAWLLACDQAWTQPQGPAPLGIGRSALIDPLGGVCARLGHAAGVLTGRIDTEAVASARARVPLFV